MDLYQVHARGTAADPLRARCGFAEDVNIVHLTQVKIVDRVFIEAAKFDRTTAVRIYLLDLQVVVCELISRWVFPLESEWSVSGLVSHFLSIFG